MRQSTRAARARRAGLIALPAPTRDRAHHARPRLRRILVAADGTAASDGALTVAGLLARRDGAAVDVVNLVPRFAPPPPVRQFLDVAGELLGDRVERVLPQGEKALGREVRWTLRVIDGDGVAATIAATAEAEGHDLIVTGRPRRAWAARWTRRPTALAIARDAAAPVLAVPPSAARLPSRAVVALEGGEGDAPVARAAAGAAGADLVVLAAGAPESLADRAR